MLGRRRSRSAVPRTYSTGRCVHLRLRKSVRRHSLGVGDELLTPKAPKRISKGSRLMALSIACSPNCHTSSAGTWNVKGKRKGPLVESGSIWQSCTNDKSGWKQLIY